LQMNGVQKDVAVDLARSFARSYGAAGLNGLIGCVHGSWLLSSPEPAINFPAAPGATSA